MQNHSDSYLAGFLLAEIVIRNSNLLSITPEAAAIHLGLPAETVTAMLRHFQEEGMVRVTEGTILITDKEKLMKLLG